MTTTRPPGWYPTPDGSGQMYRTGTEWLPAPPPAERRFTIHYGFAFLAFVSMCVTLLFGISMIGAVSDDPSNGVGAGITLMWWLWGGFWTVLWTLFAIQHTLRARR
jgi:hypothetical protein